jgi:hypothetical protein
MFYPACPAAGLFHLGCPISGPYPCSYVLAVRSSLSYLSCTIPTAFSSLSVLVVLPMSPVPVVLSWFPVPDVLLQHYPLQATCLCCPVLAFISILSGLTRQANTQIDLSGLPCHIVTPVFSSKVFCSLYTVMIVLPGLSCPVLVVLSLL